MLQGCLVSAKIADLLVEKKFFLSDSSLSTFRLLEFGAQAPNIYIYFYIYIS